MFATILAIVLRAKASRSPRTVVPNMVFRQAFDMPQSTSSGGAPWRGTMALLLSRGAPRPGETPSRPQRRPCHLCHGAGWSGRRGFAV